MNKQMEEKFRKACTRVKSISFHPTQPTFVSGNHCGTIYVWNYHYKQQIMVLREHVGSVRTVKFHPSGEFFASGGDDKILRVWNYKTKELIQSFKGHTDYIRSVDFHPTQSWIISGSDDSTIKIWNYYTGEMLCSSSGHHHYIMSVLFLDSTHIITGSLDHMIGLWNCSNLFEKNKKFMVPDVILYQTIEAHDRGVNTLFLRDGEVLSGSDDREIKLWRFSEETLSLSKTLYAHEGSVTGVFSYDKVYYGVSEDGNISIFSGDKNRKINVNSRIWCISGKDEYFAIGTDDGLVVYRNVPDFIYCQSDGKYYYVNNGKLLVSNGDSAEVVFKLGRDKVISIQGAEEYSHNKQSESILIQYKDKYEILEKGRIVEGDLGQAVICGSDLYKLNQGNLYKNDSIINRNLNGRLISVNNSVIFLVNGKQATKITENEILVFNGGFDIKDIKYSPSLEVFAFIGSDKIVFTGDNLNLKHSISEMVEITGGFFTEDVFIYSTIKQVKYFYNEIGILQSIDSYILPVALENNKTLVAIGFNGLQRIELTMGEVKFRKAVCKDEDILGVIETEQLPGLSPLEYLIKNGKGIVALPYIQDRSKQFELYLSANDFEKAYSVCDDNKMYSQLATKALENGSFEIAEKCLKKSKDFLQLFYLYLCTKQFDKMQSLEGDELESMIKIVLEDFSIFNENLIDSSIELKKLKESKSPEVALEPKDCQVNNMLNDGKYKKDDDDKKFKKDGENVSVKKDVGKVAVEKDGDKVRARQDGEKLNSKKDNEKVMIKKDDEKIKFKKEEDILLGKREDKIKSEEEDDRAEVLSSNNSLDLKDECQLSSEIKSMSLKKKKDSCSSTEKSIKASAVNENETSDEYCSTNSSKKTGYATMNDSDIGMNIFDASLARDLADTLDIDLEQKIQEALKLVTDGKFSKAIEVFRTAIIILALNMKTPEDNLEMRGKIGTYIWGLNTEIKRRTFTDPKRNIQMALFFSSLGLEPAHAELAKISAMNVNYKNRNFKTAKLIASTLNNKQSKKVLDAEENSDAFEVTDEVLLFDTLEPSEKSVQCLLCFVKSQKGDICGACQIGFLE